MTEALLAALVFSGSVLALGLGTLFLGRGLSPSCGGAAGGAGGGDTDGGGGACTLCSRPCAKRRRS